MKELSLNIWRMLEKFMRFVVFRVFCLNLSEKKWNGFLQFVKFGIVGLSNTVISYVVYLVTLLLLQKNNLLPTTDFLVAQVVGFLLSVLWSFYWNRKYVFEAHTKEISWIWALLKTYISYAFTGLFLNTVLSILWVQMLGISKLMAPIINLLISVPLNFILNKFWAFKK